MRQFTMNVKEIEVFESIKKRINESVEARDIMPRLEASDIVTRRENDVISNKESKPERIQALSDVLQSKLVNLCDFVDALEEAGYAGIAAEFKQRPVIDLAHLVKKDATGKSYVHIAMKSLDKAYGTETFTSDDNSRKGSWNYFGNGRNLQKFFNIVSCNPGVSQSIWIHINAEATTMADQLEIPQLSMIQWMHFKTHCPLSSSSGELLTSVFSKLIPRLPNAKNYYFVSDGYGIPGLDRLLRLVPKEATWLGFCDIKLNSVDVFATVESLQNNQNITSLGFGSKDATVDSFVNLLQKLCEFQCGDSGTTDDSVARSMGNLASYHNVTRLMLEFFELSPENEIKFLSEVKGWHSLEYLMLDCGRLHQEGQTELENVIKSLPNLKEVNVWPGDFSLPNIQQLEHTCDARNVPFKKI